MDTLFLLQWEFSQIIISQAKTLQDTEHQAVSTQDKYTCPVMNDTQTSQDPVGFASCYKKYIRAQTPSVRMYKYYCWHPWFV